MFVYELFPLNKDAVVRPDAQWYECEFGAISCRACHCVLPSFRNSPVRLVVNSDGTSVSDPIVSVWSVELEIVEVSLARDLNLQLHGFTLGEVFVGEIQLHNYVSVVSASTARVSVRSDYYYQEYNCRSCGRLCAQVDMRHEQWVAASDLADRDIVASIGGKIIVNELALARIRPSIRKRLAPLRYEVREGAI